MIDAKAWHELSTARFGNAILSAEGTALVNLLDRICAWVSQHAEGPNMAVFYDAGRQNDPSINLIFSLLQSAVVSRPEVKSVNFFKVKETPPLQGADMIATESFWYAQHFLAGDLSGVRAHFKHYLKHNFERGNGAILDRSGVKKVVADQLQKIEARVMASPCWQWRARLA